MSTKEKYRKLKKEAHDLFVSDGLSAVEISGRLGVSKKSISAWVNENEQSWKRERDARANAQSKSGDNIREIISMLSDKKLQILRDISDAEVTGDKERLLELRKGAASLSNEVAQWNKTLQEMDKKGNRITLAIFLEVMDTIFDQLRNYDIDLYNKSLDFQELLVNEQTKILS